MRSVVCYVFVTERECGYGGKRVFVLIDNRRQNEYDTDGYNDEDSCSDSGTYGEEGGGGRGDDDDERDDTTVKIDTEKGELLWLVHQIHVIVRCTI